VTADSGSNGTGAWQPAFPGQRRPFAPGHTVSMVTGTQSPRRVGPLAAEIEADLLADPDTPEWVRRPQFAEARAAYARSCAIVRMLSDHLDTIDVVAALTELTTGIETEERTKTKTTRRTAARRVASVLSELHRAETRSNSLRRELGLTPASAARLGRDLSQSRWYQAATPLDRRLAEIEAQRQAAIPAAAPNGTAQHPREA
jgi:hypothetical protein